MSNRHPHPAIVLLERLTADEIRQRLSDLTQEVRALRVLLRAVRARERQKADGREADRA